MKQTKHCNELCLSNLIYLNLIWLWTLSHGALGLSFPSYGMKGLELWS